MSASICVNVENKGYENGKIYDKLLKHLRKVSMPSLVSNGLAPMLTKSMEFLAIALTF